MAREEELLLIRRFKSGDTGSFEELVNMFRQKGYNLAYQWTNNQEDALDVLQEAFIKMHKVILKWKPDSSLFTWLYRVIINQAIDLKRRKKGMAVISSISEAENGDEEMEFQAPDAHRPDKQMESRELNDLIYNAAMNLPKRQREIFVLKNYQGLMLKEIAEICQCPVGTVKANLFQAVRKLRIQLAEFRKRDS